MLCSVFLARVFCFVADDVFVLIITAPLNLQPTNNREKYINDMRTQYRTYYLEYNVHDVGAIFTHNMFY
jgi:hypothetical protein